MTNVATREVHAPEEELGRGGPLGGKAAEKILQEEGDWIVLTDQLLFFSCINGEQPWLRQNGDENMASEPG